MKKTFTKIVILAFPLFFVGNIFVFANPPTSSGTNPPPTSSGQNAPLAPLNVKISFANPFGNTADNIPDFLRALIDKVVLPIGAVLAVLAFIYSGFLYVTAQGDETKIKTAHKALLYTSIGTAILLGSWVIANVINNTVKQLM